MTGALPSKKLVVAHGRPTANSAKGGMNIQMGLTIGGAALLLCLTLIGCALVVNFLDTTNALTAPSQAFRKTLADTQSADIASMMKPLWVLARQAVDEMEETRSIDGVKVMPPSLETIHDHADDLHTLLKAKVNSETHMRQVESLQNFEHNNFSGVVRCWRAQKMHVRRELLHTTRRLAWTPCGYGVVQVTRRHQWITWTTNTS